MTLYDPYNPYYTFMPSHTAPPTDWDVVHQILTGKSNKPEPQVNQTVLDTLGQTIDSQNRQIDELNAENNDLAMKLAEAAEREHGLGQLWIEDMNRLQTAYDDVDALSDLCSTLQQQVDSAPTAWIDVHSELPSRQSWVLICLETGVITARYTPLVSPQASFIGKYDGKIYFATHWMPIPPCPSAPTPSTNSAHTDSTQATP